MNPSFPDLIASGRPIRGIWRLIPSDDVTEIVGKAGFHFHIFDREHGPFDFSQLRSAIPLAELHGGIPFVRVTGLDPAETQRCLDLGAQGIVFPQLRTLGDFVTAARLVQYPPKGVRGFNPFTRSHGYGKPSAHPVSPVCMPIIETLTAVEALDDILRIPEIPAFYIGTYDLSSQLGCQGDMAHPRLLSLVEEIARKITVAGKASAAMVGSPSQGDYYLRHGVRIHVHTVDTLVIREAFEARLNP